MKRILLLALFSITLMGCTDDPQVVAEKAAQLRAEQHPERTYIGEHNYYTMESSEHIEFASTKKLEVIYQKFPRYFVEKAQEWPKEDINDPSSYDLPRFQFAWANDSGDYEGGIKIWSMKTDGTDLRLVTDVTTNLNAVRHVGRSPNNRYAVWGTSGGTQSVYDLKTGKVTEISAIASLDNFLWSEDSRYLYFNDYNPEIGSHNMRWDTETGALTPVDFKFNNFSIITDDKLIALNDYGVYKLELKSKKGILIDSSTTLPNEKSKLDMRSISPTGRYAWGSNPSFGFFFDIEKGTVKQMSDGFIPAQILGENAHYSAFDSFAKVRVVDRIGGRVWSWRPFSYGALSGDAILYNGLANDGLWFKEEQ